MSPSRVKNVGSDKKEKMERNVHRSEHTPSKRGCFVILPFLLHLINTEKSFIITIHDYDMEVKDAVIIFGIILIIVGGILMAITEDAGDPGTEVTPIAEVSEEVHPYFWHGLVLIVVGGIIVVVASVKMV